MSATIATLDDLFFGSARVQLASVPGEVVRFRAEEWEADMSDAALATTLARSRLIAAEPGGPADVAVPCIPAREIVLREGVAAASSDVSDWPEALRRPLLKVPAIPSSADASADASADGDAGPPPERLALHAVASGTRSCLVKVGEGEWWRLKGSGNHDQGFVLRVNAATPAAGPDREPGKPTYRDMRGSAFAATAVRENFMTAFIGSALTPLGIPAANEARGMYHYSAPSQCPLGLANPEVRPCCIVERTFGDRRLGSHLLAGLELLLPALLDESRLSPHALRALFPPARFAPKDPPPSAVSSASASSSLPPPHGGGDGFGADEWPPATTAELAYVNAQVAQAGMLPGGVEMALWAIPEQFHALVDRHEGTFKLDSSVLADLSSSSSSSPLLPERAPIATGDDYPQQWAVGGPRPMGAEWRPLWDETVRSLAESLEAIGEGGGGGGGGKCVLGYLFGGLGRDCGRFLRELHRLRVSWGTYQDEMCRRDLDEWHCNAHANNVVLLTEEEGTRLRSFLSYLDLDMAFDDRTFVDTWAADKGGGGGEPAAWPGGHAAGAAAGGGGGGGGGGRKEQQQQQEAEEEAEKRRKAHDDLLLRESVNFMEVLAGGDSSNGVPQIARAVVDAQSAEVQAAKTALYDTLILAFTEAYQGDAGCSFEFDPQLHAAAFAMCKLAVIVMADFVA